MRLPAKGASRRVSSGFVRRTRAGFRYHGFVFAWLTEAGRHKAFFLPISEPLAWSAGLYQRQGDPTLKVGEHRTANASGSCFYGKRVKIADR